MKKLIVVFISFFIAGCATGAMWEDMAPSSVTSSVEDGATDVDPNTASFSITFVKAVDVSTVTTSTFFLVEVGPLSSISKAAFDLSVCDPSKAIPATVTCSSSTKCIITPYSPLDSGTQCAICLKNIKYFDGNFFPDKMIRFTTAKAEGEEDEVAPTITGVTPADGATNVAVNTTVTATFSEAMKTSTITTDTFTLALASGLGPVSGVVSYDAGTKMATFTPDGLLANETIYTATLSTGVKDASGNSLSAYSWSFTTSAGIIAPTVSAVSPLNGSTEVALNSNITATFDKVMNASTIDSSTFTITSIILGTVSGAVSYDAATKTAQFNPTNLLANGYVYTATLTTGIKDASGNSLAANYPWSFTAKTYTASLFYRKYGENEGHEFGLSVAGGGDKNNDGYADIIAGAPYADSDGEGWWDGGWTFYGGAYVYSGLDESELWKKYGDAESDDRFGASVDWAGDVNGDGYDDFIVGATLPWYCNIGPLACFDPVGEGVGYAYVYSGLNGSKLWQVSGEADGADRFGVSVAGVGDLNGDGKDDFIVGAKKKASSTGRVYVYSGDTGGLLTQVDGDGKIDGEAAGDNFGVSVDGVGDLNGDGTPDFIVGAWGVDTGGLGNQGRVYVYSGATGGLLTQVGGDGMIDGGAAGDSFGLSVKGAGDVDGDTVPDFIVGALYADPGGLSDAGSAYVYSGADGTELSYSPLNGGAAYDNFGVSVDGAGDVNGDGYADFIVGAWYADPGPGGLEDAGIAYVYSGRDGSLLTQVNGGEIGYSWNVDSFGISVAGAGDVNGDGKDDFIVGASYSDVPGYNDDCDPVGYCDVGSASVYISE